jgi:hypothetical protein
MKKVPFIIANKSRLKKLINIRWQILKEYESNGARRGVAPKGKYLFYFHSMAIKSGVKTVSSKIKK